MPIDYSEYPDNWRAISRYIREVRAKNKCEFCGAPNGRYIIRPRNDTRWKLANPDWPKATLIVLTVAHINPDKMDVRYNPDLFDPDDKDNNLVAECQRCHLIRDAEHHANNRKFGNRDGQIELF